MKKILLSLAAVFALAAIAPHADAALCAAGDKGQVLWKGTWYPATVLKAKESSCFIHYDGYGSNWDEWVGPDRIKVSSSGGATAKTVVDTAGTATFKEGESVSVLWKGKWYPASVLKVMGGGRYRIHYDGYDASWDENVGPSRIRAR